METLTKEKIQKGLEVLNGRMDGKLLTHLNSCVHCGLCAESCIYYKVDPDEHYVPAKKVDIVSSVYHRYNTFSGKLAPWLTGARKLDDATIEEMVAFESCIRCARLPPMGSKPLTVFPAWNSCA